MSLWNGVPDPVIILIRKWPMFMECKARFGFILTGSLATDSKILCADKSVILTFYVTSVVLTFCDSNFFTNHTGLCLAAEWIRTAVLLEVLGDKFHHVHPWLLLILVCFGDCIVWICLDMFGL